MSELPPIDAAIRGVILNALQHCGGNQTQAAQMLLVSRWTLARYMRKYHVRKEEYEWTGRRPTAD